MKKKLMIAFVFCTLLLTCAACGEQTQPEETIQSVVEAMIEDDPQLQEMLLQNVSYIGPNVEPGDNNAMQEDIDDYLRQKFGAWFSEKGLEKALADGSLSLSQLYLAMSEATAQLEDLTIIPRDDVGRNFDYSAQLLCKSGDTQEVLEVTGYMYLDDQGTADQFAFDREYVFEQWAQKHITWLPTVQ